MKVQFFGNISYIPTIPQTDIKKRKTAEFSLFLLLLLSFVLYALIPRQSDVSLPLFYICFILMLFSNYIYFKAKKKKNYLDFDTIFIFVYCLVGFSTTFVYGNDLLFKAVFLGFPVEEEYINTSNLLFLIGLQAYFLGSLKRIRIKKEKAKAVFISTQIMALFIFILCIAFIASGGISYYRSVYNTDIGSDGPGISKHILLLLTATSIAAIATEFYNKAISSKYKINKLLLIIILLTIALLLWAGNRTAASQLLLPTICLYTLLFRNISFKSFFGLSLIGILLMWGIQNTRSNEGFSLVSPILLISDLTIPARTTYSSLDYVDQYGYTYGKSMSMGIIGTIPFLPSLVAGNNNLAGSADLLTEYTYDRYKTPRKFQIGLGTTIIGDIYLAFGIIGVILLMYLLGYLVNKYTVKTLLLDYYSMIILAGLLANAIFLVRASYTHPIRYILWALIIAYLNKNLLIQWRK